MSWGGPRPNAGRPKGAATRFQEEARKKALEGGISPLEYLLDVMRDEGEEKATRIDAAKAAAPYVHAKLQTVALTDENHSGPAKLVIEWLK